MRNSRNVTPVGYAGRVNAITEPQSALIEPATLNTILTEAVQAGAEFAEVFAEDVRNTSVSFDDNKVESLSSSHDRGAGIRVTRGATTGFAHVADLSSGALQKATRSALDALGQAEKTSQEVVVSDSSVAPLSIERDPASIEKQNKVGLLQAANDKARSVGSAIAQVNARYGDVQRHIQVANSDGLLRSDSQTRTLFSINAVASGDSGLQTGYESIGLSVGYELFDLYNVEELAETAANRAVMKLDAKPAPSGTLPVVIGPGSGGVVFHEACGHGLEADLVHKGASAFAGKVGEQVASPLVTLIDDGTMGKEWGHYSIDDEGAFASRNLLIENGILVDYLWDAKTAREHNRQSSGNGRRQSYKHLPMVRMTNTYLAAGTSAPEDIIASVDYGVYVSKLGGGQVDTASGDFVFGMVEAFLIEGGKITSPLREGQLIGNGPKVLQQIEAVGNDFAMGPPGRCGKDGQGVPVGDGVPTLKVAELTIGGTAA